MAPQRLRILEEKRSHPDPWMILALPVGEGTPEGLCDVLIDHINTIPDVMRGSLTWDHGCGDAPVMLRSAWLPT